MPRIVKEGDYAARRNEILDVARKLVYTKGYEQMSIQDILDASKISKGAFYHYFHSKQDLMDGLVERMLDEGKQTLLPILQGSSLSALEKIQQYFNTSLMWKSAQKDFLLALLPTWYSDNNVLLRQKMISEGLKSIGPPLAQVIRQGVEEGTLSTRYPDQAFEMCFHLLQGLSDKMVEVILADPRPPNGLRSVEEDVEAYTNAIERILGAPPGSMKFMDSDSLKVWFE